MWKYPTILVHFQRILPIFFSMILINLVSSVAHKILIRTNTKFQNQFTMTPYNHKVKLSTRKHKGVDIPGIPIIWKCEIHHEKQNILSYPNRYQDRKYLTSNLSFPKDISGRICWKLQRVATPTHPTPNLKLQVVFVKNKCLSCSQHWKWPWYGRESKGQRYYFE
jgi:hypothetical protein